MPTADQITDTTPTVEVVANVVHARTRDYPIGPNQTRSIARNILNALVGADDEPGPLDRYELRTLDAKDGGKSLIVWFCPRQHLNDDGEPGGDGHVGIIARNFDGDQTGLTLGEILEAVLRHEREEHE